MRRRVQICPVVPPCSANTQQVFACHCEERSDAAIRNSCGRAWQRAVPKANTGKCCGFAQSSIKLPGFSAGTRIAAPVCALVRNDMQKTEACQRVQECLARKVRRNLPGACACKSVPPPVIARSEATRQSVTPAVGHGRGQCLRRIRESAADLPKVVLSCQGSLQGRGLPHQCAHWFAMTCRRQRRVSGCKNVWRVRCAGTCQAPALARAYLPLSLRGAKRRGNPRPAEKAGKK